MITYPDYKKPYLMKRYLLIFAFLFVSLTCNLAYSSTDNIALLTAKANQNDPQAQYNLAQSYALGVDTEKNIDTAFHWYQQAAKSGHKAAQYKLAQAYELGEGTTINLEHALRWYTQLALEGDSKAPLKLASLFERTNVDISELDMAEIWYQIAADTLSDAKLNTQAEDGYYRVLERQFNTQRAKQLSSIDQLDAQIDPITLDIPQDEQDLPENSDSWSFKTFMNQLNIFSGDSSIFIYAPWLIIAILSLVLIMAVKRNRHDQTNELMEQQLKLQEELKAKTFTIKQLKRQLETVFREFKKHQNSSKNQKLNISCAIFGFTPSNIPDEKKIKLRFKQLSRIYHPDMKGSEEEMKRLNGALKTILHNVTKK